MPTLAELVREWPASRDEVAARARAALAEHARRAGLAPDAADEVAQEGTIKLLAWLDGGPRELRGTGEGFLRVCARNAVESWRRTLRPAEGTEPIEAHPDPGPSPDRVLEEHQLEHRVRRAMGDLGEGDRSLLVRVHVDGQPLQELVEAELSELGASADPFTARRVRAAFDKRLQRARARLAARLRALDEEAP